MKGERIEVTGRMAVRPARDGMAVPNRIAMEMLLAGSTFTDTRKEKEAGRRTDATSPAKFDDASIHSSRPVEARGRRRALFTRLPQEMFPAITPAGKGESRTTPRPVQKLQMRCVAAMVISQHARDTEQCHANGDLVPHESGGWGEWDVHGASPTAAKAPARSFGSPCPNFTGPRSPPACIM